MTKLTGDDEWVLAMAEREMGCMTSVGGFYCEMLRLAVLEQAGALQKEGEFSLSNGESHKLNSVLDQSNGFPSRAVNSLVS